MQIIGVLISKITQKLQQQKTFKFQIKLLQHLNVVVFNIEGTREQYKIRQKETADWEGLLSCYHGTKHPLDAKGGGAL